MTQRRATPIHHLRGNETCWTPAQVIYLDTESRWRHDRKGETHTLRLWAATLVSRRPDSTGWTGETSAWGHTAAQLAEAIGVWCKGQKSVWLLAHNLSFDLTVGELPQHLQANGAVVTDHAAGSETPWLRMKLGTATLTMADSWGWLRAPIWQVGITLGHPKPPLPPEDADDDYWLARCRADVSILAEAMGQVMRWWDSADLGRWSLTGSASGWNVMRHKMARKRITIIPGDDGANADRAAVYGGRRECFRWGDLAGGPWTEHDFESAYPQIVATMPLPARRAYGFNGLPLDSPLARGAGLGVIAKVLVETDIPRWPCRAGGRVWYPVGSFWTTLAGPEIAEATRLGCVRQIGPGYAHALSYALQPWAKWLLAAQGGEMAGVPGVAVPMVKHWGRSCIGKFAARGYTKELIGPALSDVWTYEPVWDVKAQAHGAIVSLGGRRWKCLAASNGDNTYPAVLAYVESYVRARLTRVIEAVGRGRVVTCDTDGIIMRSRTTAGDGVTRGVTAPLVLRRKGSWRRLQVTGPQHIVRDGHRSYSGVPGSAVQLADGTLQALVWPRLAWQLREHAGAGYRRPAQDYVIGASYASGWTAADGAVLPVVMRAAADGPNHMVPWSETPHARSGARLGDVQAPAVLATFGLE